VFQPKCTENEHIALKHDFADLKNVVEKLAYVTKIPDFCRWIGNVKCIIKTVG